jgi:hypothetical protein
LKSPPTGEITRFLLLVFGNTTFFVASLLFLGRPARACLVLQGRGAKGTVTAFCIACKTNTAVIGLFT